jgi:exosortase E/protease (VPEID-CTERM system)
MFIDLASSRTARFVRSQPLVRWMGLVALLVGEVLFMQVQFDTNVLAGNTQWWARVLGEAHYLPWVAITSACALVLLGGKQLLAELQRLLAEGRTPRSIHVFLTAQLVAFLAFYQTTAFVLGPKMSTAAFPGLWFLAWILMGGITVAFWLGAMVPPELWPAVFLRVWKPAALGLGVGVLACVAGELSDQLWKPLGYCTMWLAHGMLSLVTRQLVYDPSQFVLGTTKFWVVIAPACSGYEGIGLIAVFFSVYLWAFRRRLRFPQALLLLPMGALVVSLANGVRIAGLVAVGTWMSPEIALGGFHSQAGGLAFNAVGLGLIAITQKMHFFTRIDAAPVREREPNYTAAFVAPLLVLVSVVMITSAFTVDFDWLYPVRFFAVALVLWSFRKRYGEWQLRLSMSGLILGVVCFVVWMALEPAHQAAAPAALATVPFGWAVTWVFFRVIGSCVTVPVAEELAFRGFLARQLINRDFQNVPYTAFTWFSFAFSSLLFGLMHGRWVAGTLAGMIFAYAMYRRGKLSDAIVAHATTNALIAVYVLTTGSWQLWS